MNKLRFYTGLITTLFALQSMANVRLPQFVTDNMVLQRDIKIPVWGWADAGEKVTLKFLNKIYTALPDIAGKWTLSLPPTPAGGPYELIVKGKNEIVLKNILVGDVWVCSGQSNMEMTMAQCRDKYKDEIAKGSNINIRLIKFDRVSSPIPLSDAQTSGWKMCTPEILKDFSAVAYFFGKEIHQQVKVPIGLISDNWGGASAEAWMSADALKSYPDYLDQASIYSSYQARFADWNKQSDAMNKTALSDTSWAKNDTDLSSWTTMQTPANWNTPELSGFNGVVWMKREVKIPTDAVGQDLTLYLSTIDDEDITWFNGVRIGKTSGYDQQRKYIIPAKLVKSGSNMITIRISDYFGGGGIVSNGIFRIEGKAPSLAAMGSWLYSFPLEGAWSYKISSEFKGLADKPFPSGLRPENHSPTLIYNAMIAPLAPFAIKGVIWYQGETNGDANAGYEYRTLFPDLIANWRAKWGQGDFPFLFVQLANYRKADKKPKESAWAELREAQAMSLRVPNTAMAVTIDIGEANDIHPVNKEDVGKRLAYGGLKVAYGKDIMYSGPVYDSYQTEGDKIRLSFKNTGSGLFAKGGEPMAFAIAGEDRKFVWAHATLDGNMIVVWSEQVKNPKAVRYGWSDNPGNANLYNKEGLPASPFRTDDWKGLTQQ